MDFVTHLPQTPQRHEVGTFSNRADDLHIGEILLVIHSRDSSATWSTGIHSVG